MNQPYAPLALYIDGEFVEANERDGENVFNPADGSVLGHLPHATDRDLDNALNAAARAFDKWSKSSPLERGRILKRVAELIRERAEGIALDLTRDQGKPLAEARNEVIMAADHAEWHAEECRRIYGRVIPPRRPSVRQLVIREPVGVCAAFTPWNFPFNQALRKISAALASGCTLIIKPAEDAPSAGVALARLFHEAGLPGGCLNVVWGAPSIISRHLIESPIVRKISFTGSVAVGKQLAALAGHHMKRVTMELGGHSPVIIFDDADIERAAPLLARLKTLNAGQVCMAPGRFYVQQGIVGAFTRIFADAVADRVLGNGIDPATTMGPLAHERRVDAMEAFVRDARDRGADILTGGVRLACAGSFFPPTVLGSVSDSSSVMTEEVFGPIAPITSFNNVDEVMARANALPLGLASYVFTRSLETSHEVTSRLQAGMVNVNHFGSALPETPLGGVKDSGVGSEGGSETFDAYLNTKFISEETA